MKPKIKILFAVLVLAVAGGGCQKNLNLVPLNSVTVPDFFQDQSDFQEFVNGLYPSMVPGQGTPYFDMPSDVNIINSGRTDEPYTEFALGNYDASTGDVGVFWNNSYAAIRNAYIFFQNIGNVQMPASAQADLTGSVDYLLAYTYFVMFRVYGSVPIVRSVLTTANADIPTSPPDSVFAEALKWADSACNNLPALGPTQRIRGQLTKVTALTLKTDLLLFAASRYAQSIPGATYQAAAAAAQAALTEANTDGYGLAVNYLDPFIASYQAGADAQQEIILENVRLPNIAVDAYGLSSYLFRPRYDGEGVDMFLAPQELVDLYECTDGNPINTSPLYDPTHPFRNRDPRLSYCILYPGAVVNRIDGSPSWISNSLDSSVANGDYMLETNDLRDRNSTGYINIKYWDRMNDAQTAGYGSYVVYRYAELLLMYAEAQNEASGPDATVYQALTTLRARVGMPAVTAATNPTQASVRTLIRNERAVELMGEGKRYFDILRWGTADSVLNKSYYSMHISIFNAAGAVTGYEPSIWVRTSLTDTTQESLYPVPNGAGGGNFLIQYSFQSPRNYIWPIPQSAIDQSTTGALKQNPLWQ